jgi:hypothetical protein
MSWQGAPGFTFEPAKGLTASSTPQDGGNRAVAGLPPLPAPPAVIGGPRVVMNGPGGMRVVGADGVPMLRSVTRHELPIYLKGDAAVGRAVPELKGALAGTVNLAAQVLATIADVKADAVVAAADGAKLTVRDCTVADDGAVTLKVEVERVAPGGGFANVVGRQIQIGGPAPGNIAQVLNALNGEGGDTLRLFDAQDRPYAVTVSESATNRANGVSVTTYTLDCKPAGDGAKPRRLELHGPRKASVEAKFTLRDVPLP